MYVIFSHKVFTYDDILSCNLFWIIIIVLNNWIFLEFFLKLEKVNHFRNIKAIWLYNHLKNVLLNWHTDNTICNLFELLLEWF